jgi:hypothetical protein
MDQGAGAGSRSPGLAALLQLSSLSSELPPTGFRRFFAYVGQAEGTDGRRFVGVCILPSFLVFFDFGEGSVGSSARLRFLLAHH